MTYQITQEDLDAVKDYYSKLNPKAGYHDILNALELQGTPPEQSIKIIFKSGKNPDTIRDFVKSFQSTGEFKKEGISPAKAASEGFLEVPVDSDNPIIDMQRFYAPVLDAVAQNAESNVGHLMEHGVVSRSPYERILMPKHSILFGNTDENSPFIPKVRFTFSDKASRAEIAEFLVHTDIPVEINPAEHLAEILKDDKKRHVDLSLEQILKLNFYWDLSVSWQWKQIAANHSEAILKEASSDDTLHSGKEYSALRDLYAQAMEIDAEEKAKRQKS